MKNLGIAKTEKSSIEQDLFVDVDGQNCIIDIFLQNRKEFEKNKDTLNKVSVTFFNKCQQHLKWVLDKGQILFFRKYNYEKILNEYLCTKYGVNNLGMDSIFSESSSNDNSQKVNKEIQKEKQEQKEKEREEKEKEVLANISSVEWTEIAKGRYIYYEGVYHDGKTLKLRVNNTGRKNRKATKSWLKYDNKKFYYVDYDINAVLNMIKRTHPQKTENIFDISKTEKVLREVEKSGNDRTKGTHKKESQKEDENRQRQEQEVLSNIGNIVWEKVIGGNYVIYEGVFDNKKVEFRMNNTIKKKNPSAATIFKYDEKLIRYVKYNGDKILELIEGTNPQIKKNKNIVVVMNKERLSKKKPPSPSIDPEIEKERKEELIKRNAELEAQRKLKEERKRLREECMRAQQEAKRLKQIENQKQIQQKEKEEQELLRQLPQIGVKDFVVRRAIFKCMHSKHNVVDLAAAVKIIGDDGKAKLVKVSAGYCKVCKIYFIMESTYEKLRNMGVVLCRICDEKSYMKNSFVNGMKLAQESILMQFGYTVSQIEGLSATKRQKILAVIIDNHILSKSEIISYLDFFISQRQYQSKFEIAVSKWETDREFVQEYKIGEYTQFGVNAIYRR